MAIHAAGLAAHQFRHIGVLLLRHDRRAGAEAVGQLDEVELGAGPQYQLLGEARQVHHRQRGGGAEFDGEVAVGNAVQRVAGYRIEAQQLAGQAAVDRVGGAGQGGTAQRHAVDPLAAVEQALAVAAEHLEPGQQVVAEGHRLGGLQMGEAGHDHRGMLLGLIQQAALQALQFGNDDVDLLAQPQADVGGDLIIARTAGVQLLAGNADALGQPRLDVHVHIFQIHPPIELSGLDFALDRPQPVDDAVAFAVAEHANLRQHGGMGDGALNVMLVQALVEIDRGSETGDEGVHRFAETAAPGLIGSLILAHGSDGSAAEWEEGP